MPFYLGALCGAPAIDTPAIPDSPKTMGLPGSDLCPACGAAETRFHDFPFPLFRHLDFVRIVTDKVILGECGSCGIIFRVARAETLQDIDALYLSDLYAAHDEVHAISVPGRSAPVPASSFQAEALAGCLPETPPRILDFGCFNGRLLHDFSLLRPDAILVGYDVAVRTGFPQGEAFTFYSGDWRDIEGPFDLVCMSHSIQYVREIADLLDRIHLWLSPAGRIFVQTPDVLKKPCALLLGDLHYHFSGETLAKLMSDRGFAMETLEDMPFPRDITLLGRVDGRVAGGAPRGMPVLETAYNHVQALSGAITARAGEEFDGILGTTIEAAFVDEELGARTRFFVDENPERIGQTFRGRPVLHPADVTAGSSVLVPLGSQAERVAERLSATFPSRFVAL